MNTNGINYFPASGKDTFGESFDEDAITADFARMARMGAKVVRIFVPPATFGYPMPSSAMQVKLAQVFDIAATHGLRIHLTLFDLDHDYADVRGSKTWAAAILAPFRDDRRLVCVELKNEVNPESTDEIAWVKALLPFVRKISVGPWHTVSIADKGPDAFHSLVTQLAATPPDVWSYHYYGPAVDAEATFVKLRTYAAPRALVIGETGQSTYGHTDLNVQANYFRYICGACLQVGLPLPGIWQLNDMADPSLPPKEQEFGLVDVDGNPKPAAYAVAQQFGGEV